MNLTSIYIILLLIGILSILLYLRIKNKKVKLISTFILIITIITTCILSYRPLFDNINYGLDLQGGFEVLYEISSLKEDEDIDSDML